MSVGGTHRFQIGSPYLTFRDSNNSSTRSISYNTTFVSGEWVHIACIYNRGQIIIYVNGVQTNRNSTYFHEDSVLYFDLNQYRIGRIRVSTGDIHYNGKLNDFRIYDHALSAMEVKQLSQGLILHYSLNNNGWGNENLYGTGGDCTETLSGLTNYGNKFAIINEEGQSCAHVAGTLKASAYLKSNVAFVPQPNEIVTFSAYVKIKNIVRGTTNPMCGFYFGGQTIDGAWRTVQQIKLTVDGVQYNVGASSWDQAINDTKWHKVVCSAQYANYTFTSNITGGSIYLRDCTGDLYLHHVKFERGINATSWCPTSSDELYTLLGLNNSIEYDCSGYQQNGIKIGNFEYTTDTPKYNVSTVFNGSNYIEAEPLPDETKTISVWVNYQTLPTGSDYSGFIMFDKNTQISICVYSGGQYLIPYIGSSKGGTGSRVVTSFQTNKWYHIVVLKTGATTREVYINGVKATPSGTNYWSGDLNKLLIGIRHASGAYKDGANAKICDFRAYATLLSPQDILSLYNNEAYIDNNGNIYGAVYEEA